MPITKICPVNNFLIQVDEEELWASMVQTTRGLLRLDLDSGEVDSADLWEDFELSGWDRTKLRLSEDHLHALPHAGECERTLGDGSKVEQLVKI